jgi:integrase
LDGEGIGVKVGDDIRTAAMTHCACRAKAVAAMRWRSTCRRLRDARLLEASGDGADSDGPLRPLKHNGKRRDERRGMDPDAIDRVVRKYAAALGLDRGYSAHSMRATFITTALENGAQLEDVQKAAGHRDPSTTKLYDRRGYNPEKAASFFATS